MSYDLLKQHLAAGKFQDADNETRAKLIQLAGKDAQKRGWVYFSEVQFIPVSDLQILDNLWRAASGDLFGYAAQKEVWQQNRCGGAQWHSGKVPADRSGTAWMV